MQSPAETERAESVARTRRRWLPSGPRGYIMLIVLCILALLAIAVGAELQSAGVDVTADVRQIEDERARAAAEACLDMMQAYADDYMRAYNEWYKAGQVAEGEGEIDRAPYFDFDGLLDPDANLTGNAGSTRHDGDEHVPPFAKTVYLPKNLVGNEEHRWGIVDLGSGSKCLVRVEDNSDDGFFSSAASFQTNDDVKEGCDLSTENGKTAKCPRKEVTDRDNDGAVFLSVVGLYPVPPGVPDPDAYETAHARVGIRRLTSRAQEEDVDAELLNSKTKVALVGQVEVCGRGGVTATDFAMAPTSCACGQLHAQSYVPVNPPDTGCGCATCNAITKEPLSSPVPAFDTSLGVTVKAGVPPTLKVDDWFELGDDSYCSFYLDGGDFFYVFDLSDKDAKNQGGVAVDCKAGSECVDECVDSRDGTVKKMGSPCTWQLDPAAGPVGVRCDVGQTPCWKPIAKLGGLGTLPDVWLGPMPAGASKNWVSGPNDITMRKSEPIPNVKSAKQFGGSNPFCGRKNACNNCDGTQQVFREVGGQLETAPDLDENAMPVPSFFFVDGGGRDVEIRKTGGPFRLPLSVIAQGSITVDRDASLCCAECGCEDKPNPADCYFEFDFNTNNGTEGPAASPVIKSAHNCDVKVKGYMTGDIDCKSESIDDDLCLHGDVYNYVNNLTCRGDPAGTCIDGGNNVGIFGGVYAQGSVMSYAANKQEFDVGITAGGKVKIAGGTLRLGATIQANDDVRIDNVGDIVDTAPSGFTVKKVLTYSETTW